MLSLLEGAFIFCRAMRTVEPMAIAGAPPPRRRYAEPSTRLGPMGSRRGRTLVFLSLAVAVLGGVFDLVLLLAWGARAPAWSHWFCSPAFHASARHPEHQVGGLAATLLASLKALVPHWPHIMPIAVALTTLVYLRRANVRYHTDKVGFEAPAPRALRRDASSAVQ